MSVKLKEFASRVMAGHKKGCELTDVQRACMATAVACGLSQYDVANAFGVGRTTVRAQVQKVTISPRFKSRIRKRRPKMLSFTAKRRLHWLAKRNPKSTWKQLRNSMGGSVSPSDTTPRYAWLFPPQMKSYESNSSYKEGSEI
jgi:hypothetical protein